LKQINKILVANRGEIAVRIIRTARSMGITTVAIYAGQEGQPMHRDHADEAWSLGTGSLEQTYLHIDRIIDIALNSGADAIHPGYGFLAENPDLALACRKNGLTLIGPPEKAIRIMGNKLQAAGFVGSLEVPMLQIKTGPPKDLAQKVSPEDFPLMIKAAAGGGGKGMRIVRNPKQLHEALTSTAREAANYFGDDAIYVEKYIDNPRHIEIQILADLHHHVVHLFERECSIQRRHQKIIEEAPAPSLDEKTRHQMGETAIRIAREIGYTGAGTVEFLVDDHQNFYFLEMNTRIQVEHPVTEMITGIDLVRQQILIASGHPLPWSQKEIAFEGHALETRIYAEDPLNDFMPSPGTIRSLSAPGSYPVRIDTGVRSGDEIFPDYDPLIAKMATWGNDRSQALDRMQKALKDTAITGIRNNQAYLLAILQNPYFLDKAFNTRFIERHHEQLKVQIEVQKQNQDHPALIAGYIFIQSLEGRPQSPEPVWQHLGYWRLHMEWQVQLDNQLYQCWFTRDDDVLYLHTNNQKEQYELVELTHERVHIRSPRGELVGYYALEKDTMKLTVNGLTHDLNHQGYLQTLQNKKQGPQQQDNTSAIHSPMFGKVLSIEVHENARVRKGQTLMVLEAMKMENSIQAPGDITIKNILVEEGQQVKDGQRLVETTPLSGVSQKNPA